MIRSIILFIVLIQFVIALSLAGQDPAYQNFNQNRFLFNPSLTGSSGAETWSLRAKSQWNFDGGGGYKTGSILFEESMPCSIIDVGFKINFNEEGKGLYRTMEAGWLTAACLAFNTSRNVEQNFRFGFDFSWGYNSIDYSKLVWSDQLDKKYGPIFNTSFIPYNTGKSSIYFNPGIGFSYKSILNKKLPKPVVINIGTALYRFYTFSKGDVNQSVSILGLRSENPYRISAFVETEFIPFLNNRKFATVRPLILYQRQGKLNYIESGLRLGYMKHAGLAFYYHFSPNSKLGSTRWMTVINDYTITINERRKLSINLSYSSNIGGLSNLVGPMFELGISIHFAKSSACNFFGKKDEVLYDNTLKCPIYSVNPYKRKIYENIWYKN